MAQKLCGIFALEVEPQNSSLISYYFEENQINQYIFGYTKV